MYVVSFQDNCSLRATDRAFHENPSSRYNALSYIRPATAAVYVATFHGTQTIARGTMDKRFVFRLVPMASVRLLR